MNFIEAMQTQDNLTENGMVTNSSSLNECVNLFFSIGAMRGQDKNRLISLFSKAYQENPLTAMRILFWSRDARSGAGERQIFRDILVYLAENQTASLRKNIKLISEFGRWDDLHVLFGTKLHNDAVQAVKNGLNEKNGLAAKWTPRKGFVFETMRKAYGMSPKEFRKMIVGLSETVEQKMCSKKWYDIKYPSVPSLAMSRYSGAFKRNDESRFSSFIEDLKSGKVKINASAVYPYNVVQNMRMGSWELANEQWKALPNYMENAKGYILPVVDVSGSMSSIASGTVSCLDVAISLGLYISERNVGVFKDAFITFSESPTLEVVKGNLKQRYEQMRDANWGYNTNLEKVFDLILNQAIKNNLSQDQMPEKVLIISDMEFDSAVKNSESAYVMIRNKYKSSGYEMPNVYFWNVQSRNAGNFPVKFDEKGTALISGLSPSVLKNILASKDIDPSSTMMDVIGDERYSKIIV